MQHRTLAGTDTNTSILSHPARLIAHHVWEWPRTIVQYDVGLGPNQRDINYFKAVTPEEAEQSGIR
jgi:hypothetical protein